MSNDLGVSAVVDRSTFQAEMDALRVREKAHTREGDAIAAARRRLPMVQIESAIPLIGERGTVTLLDAFEGRRLLIAYYFMWPQWRLARTLLTDRDATSGGGVAGAKPGLVELELRRVGVLRRRH
jgi:predicted dithiol-disulfide oxidoreductase (DUF899 family)